MVTDKISLEQVGKFSGLNVDFVFPDSNMLVVTGKNGVGKTTIIKSFFLLSDPKIFQKTSGDGALSPHSKIDFELDGLKKFSFSYNSDLNGFDTRDALPTSGEVVSELPIPHGDRFNQFATVARYDSDLRAKIAAGDYFSADNLIAFLSRVYSSDKFNGLKAATIRGREYYFILLEQDYYLREDHFSSGEFFLIQLYRLINSGAKLILIDELDVALDAVAQVNLYSSIGPILQSNDSRLILISHSLAFMSTVEDGGLYYLEESSDGVCLEPRSFGYIKSDLFGFRGYDRYVITEDEVLEGFIEFVVRHFSLSCHYRHITIGVAGVNQLQMIVEKNDANEIFSSSDNVVCVVDGDSYEKFNEDYDGPTRVISSPVIDLELYVYRNRDVLLGGVALPEYQESNSEKKASKSYWKWLTIDKGLSSEHLYEIIVNAEPERAETFKEEIQSFLGK